MPFHNQPGLARAAALRARDLDRARIRNAITAVLQADPHPIPVHAVQVRLRIRLGIGAIRRNLNAMTTDGLTRRERWAGDPRYWAYTLTIEGHHADHSFTGGELDRRRSGQQYTAAQQRSRTRAAILAALDVWPNARTARYVANHIGMSTSAVRRAMTALIDSGEVLTAPHPFFSRQRLYFLPRHTMM